MMADSLLARLDVLAVKARPWVPFTALNTVWRMLDKDALTILDIGCGKGEPMAFINRHRQFHTVGADIFRPYLEGCRCRGTHDEYIQCDVRCLPFGNKSFDVVLCLEVLEHLEREEGQRLLQELERIAKKQIILSTPVGNHTQREYDMNPHQEHKYVWSPKDIKNPGYRVFGIGIRNLDGKSGMQSPLLRALRPLVNILWVLAGPFVYLVPGLAGDVVCIKNF